MSDLRVVETEDGQPKYPDELHIRIHYSADYAVASLYEGDEIVAYSVGFESVEPNDGWDNVRTKLIEQANARAAIIRKYGNPPKNEVVELEDAGSV